MAEWLELKRVSVISHSAGTYFHLAVVGWTFWRSLCPTLCSEQGHPQQVGQGPAQ